MTGTTTDTCIERVLLELLARRSPKSICPSEVARTLYADGNEWRDLMPAVRDVAVRLARAGVVDITRSGRTLSPDAIEGGPIRITLRAPGD